jgi:5-hydroxyisourate hydrolase-like protein (transthyretin family)
MISALLIALLLQRPAAVPPQTASGSIAGVVTRQGSGDPISGVRVTVLPTTSLSAPTPPTQTTTPLPQALTDGQGRFELNNLSPGFYRLTLSRVGYVRQESSPGGGAGVTIELKAGEPKRNVLVKMIPTGVMTGHVRDTAGRPLTGVEVQLLKSAYNENGRKTTSVVLSTRTNDRGEYRIYYVSPGRYFAKAGSPAQSDLLPRALAPGASPNEFSTSVSTAYYPNARQLEKAVSIDIQPGAEVTGIDFILAPQRLYTIRGRFIEAATGAPFPSAQLLLTARGINGNFQPFGDSLDYVNAYSAGAFVLRNVPPGTYGLVLSSSTFATLTLAEVVDSDLDLGTVAVTRGVTISGQVALEKGSASEGFDKVRVMLSPSSEGVPVLITNLGRSYVAPGPDGAFTIENVQPIEYRLLLATSGSDKPVLPPGLYVKQARFGDTDVLAQPIRDVTRDSKGLNILIASDSGQLSGTVMNDDRKPAAGIQIALIPERLRNRADLFKSAVSDLDGRFQISSIPPGDYKVFAWDAIEPYSWFDPGVLKSFEDMGTAVRVEPNGKQSIQLKAPAGKN